MHRVPRLPSYRTNKVLNHFRIKNMPGSGFPWSGKTRLADAVAGFGGVTRFQRKAGSASRETARKAATRSLGRFPPQRGAILKVVPAAILQCHSSNPWNARSN